MADAVHEIYGVKFAHNPNGTRGHYFYGQAGNPKDEPAPLDYFVWLLRSGHGDVIVDAGFTAQKAAEIDREYLHTPSEGLAKLGVVAGAVDTVILTHLHFDHTGDLRAFPNANVVLQEAEMAFWTGRWAARPEIIRHVEPGDVAHLVQRNFAGHIRWVDGDEEVLPGIWVHQVAGHTPGSQAVRVRTAGGDVLLAGDAAHFYEELEQQHPFSVFLDLPGMYRSFDRMTELAADGFAVPGHDPRIIERFPAVPGHEGVIVKVA